MNLPPVVSAKEWEAARLDLLTEEKALTRARDALAAKRRRMPRMAIEKDYRFEGPDGEVGLLDLFEGRRQLIVYRFFFEPGVAKWPESGCPGCSFMADQVAHLAHLNARNTTFAYVSRAPQADIERYRARMGWEIPWYTLTDDFDADFGVDEWHGTNAFYRDDDERIYRTYFIDSRGDEAMGSTWSYLDITALGPAVDAGLEEGAVDDQLPAAGEQVDEAHRAVRPFEGVVALHLQPRHPAAPGGQRVAGAGQLLLLDQQLEARGLPLLRRHDRGCVHAELP